MERSRQIVALACLAGLGLILLWLWNERRERARETQASAPEHRSELAPLSSVPSERVPAARESAPSSAPVPTPSAAPEPTRPTRLEIEVVEATLEPVPDVLVYLERQGATEGETSDKHGRVAFDLADTEFSDPAHPLRVSAAIFALERSWVVVDRATAPDQPLRLILPPHGALDVAVLAADGRPASRGLVELALAPETEGVSLLSRHGRSAWGHDGHASFEFLALGLRLALSAEAWGDPSRATARVDGPRVAGERVSAVLRLALDRTILVFRAVNERGTALSGELKGTLDVHSASMVNGSGSEVRADDEGRFEWVLDNEYAPGERRELEVRHKGRGLCASVDLSRAFPPGRIDMGELVLRAAPLIASGRVVDPQGRPLGGLEVEATPSIGTTEDGEPMFLFGEQSAITGTDGTFEVRGAIAPGSVLLQLASKDLQVQPLVVVAGATSVELVAQATGGLAGRVLFDPGVPYPSRILIDVHTDDGDATRPWQTLEEQGPPGSFEFDGLLPGSYTVTVSGDEVLAEVAGIAVVGGETSRDPRLQELDLRGRLHLFTFELVPPSPGFELRSSVSYTASGASEPVQCADWFLDEDPRLATLLAHIDATLRVEGCRVERFVDPGPHTEVHLRAGLPTRLVLPHGIALPAPPLRLGATLLDEDGKPSGASSASFDEHGELRCFAPAPGRFRVGWLLERQNANGHNSCALAVEPAQFVEVGEQDGEQRIALALTPEALARALDVR